MSESKRVATLLMVWLRSRSLPGWVEKLVRWCQMAHSDSSLWPLYHRIMPETVLVSKMLQLKNG